MAIKKETQVGATKATTPKPKVVKDNTKELELEKQLKDMQVMMAEMQKLLAQKTDASYKSSPREEYGDIVAPQGEILGEVPFRQYIRVMSLTNNRLTISTEGYGNGTVFNFVNYGQIQSILYEDLAKIIHSNPRFAREGFFFIMDSRVIKIHNMEEEYAKILTKDKIDSIVEMDIGTIRELMHNTTPHIKNTIASMVIERMINGEEIDLNKVKVISDESGKDIDGILKNIFQKDKE